MKSKIWFILTLLFFILSLFLGGHSVINHFRLEQRIKALNDREKTITEYKKVIEAIGRTGINKKELITELRKDFEINSEFGYYDYENEYYLILYPKNKEINKREIWDFYGLELILDSTKRFKKVNLHKP